MSLEQSEPRGGGRGGSDLKKVRLHKALRGVWIEVEGQ